MEACLRVYKDDNPLITFISVQCDMDGDHFGFHNSMGFILARGVYISDGGRRGFYS